MDFIEFLGDLIHRNLVLTVALAIIPLKIAMIRLCKDRDTEMETVLAIPEDLCYITIGLILSSLTAGSGPLQDYFRHSRHIRTDIGIVLALNFALVAIVHKIAQGWTRTQYMNWRAALQVRGDQAPTTSPQMTLPLAETEDNLLYIFIHYFLGLIFSLIVQVALAGFWLYRIAAVYSSR